METRSTNRAEFFNLLMWQNLFYFNLNQILQKKVLPSVVVMVKGLALKLKITPNSKSELITLRLNFSMPSDKIE